MPLEGIQHFHFDEYLQSADLHWEKEVSLNLCTNEITGLLDILISSPGFYRMATSYMWLFGVNWEGQRRHGDGVWLEDSERKMKRINDGLHFFLASLPQVNVLEISCQLSLTIHLCNCTWSLR